MNRVKGIAMIIIGSAFWGATGPMMEWMLRNTLMTAEFMLAVRLIIAGIGLLIILRLQNVAILKVWQSRPWRLQLIIFSIVGMTGLQLTFVKAIEASNAVVATLLQFLAPIFIIIYISIIYKKFPPYTQIIGMLGTLIGLFLLLTSGSFSQLEVNNTTLIWGVALGLTYAFYTLYPARLQQEWGVLLIIAWGMILSGIILACLGQIWATSEWSYLIEPNILAMMFALVVLGASAFILFLSSMKYISPVETSILSSVEPLTAMVISALWLDAYLKNVQYIGAVLMLIFIIYLSIAGKGKRKST